MTCDVCGARLDPDDMTATGYHAALLETAHFERSKPIPRRAWALVVALYAATALLLAGCGRTPTGPARCTAARATSVDTLWTVVDGQRVVAAIKYECMR